LTTLAYGKKCIQCFNSGFSGRVAIGELLETRENIRNLIMDRASSQEIRREAVANGMVPIKMDGLKKVFDKITALEAVFAQVSEEE
jgi:type IV pilus assembly protein PilB